MGRRFIIVYLMMVTMLYSCGNKLSEVDAIIASSASNIETAENVELFYSNNGVIRAKLSAPSFTHVTNATPPYVAMKKGIKVSFYNGEKEPTSTLTAKRGHYFENTNNVLVRDSVKVVSAQNETLSTEELIWNEKQQKFFTNKYVTIQTADQLIYGDGMEANQDFTNYKIINPKGVIQLDKSKQKW
jgi:LPS export ABC transporter protein LptC